jgi:predicted HTH transcriptional regulator
MYLGNPSRNTSTYGEILIMIQNLTLDEILNIIKIVPEQCIYDWKQDLSIENEDKKSELVKDIVAIANATTTFPGFVFYGVDPRRPDCIVGMGKSYDDASFQQMIANKVAPPVEFLYYEVCHGAKLVGVVHIPPSHKRPHIIAKDFGKLREGQILIRRGSSTKGINQSELFEIFYSQTSPYFQGILRKHGIEAMHINANVAFLRELRVQIDQTEREMEDMIFG